MNRKLFVVLSASVAMAACGSEGGGANPAPRPSTPEGGVSEDASSTLPDAMPDSPPDAPVVPRRTVIQRDPFGNYAETGNLLYDGDFEWSMGMISQYPWFAWPSAGFTPPPIVRGPACRSGMSCARVEPGAGVAGIGMNPAEGKQAVSVSLWVRPMQGDQCPNVAVSLEGCFQATETQSLPDANEPLGPDGWCRRSGVLAVPEDTPCVFVSVQGSSFNSVIVDDVVMKAAPAGAKLVRSTTVPSWHRRAVSGLRENATKLRRPPPVRPAAPFSRRFR